MAKVWSFERNSRRWHTSFESSGRVRAGNHNHRRYPEFNDLVLSAFTFYWTLVNIFFDVSFWSWNERVRQFSFSVLRDISMSWIRNGFSTSKPFRLFINPNEKLAWKFRPKLLPCKNGKVQRLTPVSDEMISMHYAVEFIIIHIITRFI